MRCDTELQSYEMHADHAAMLRRVALPQPLRTLPLRTLPTHVSI